MEKTIETEVETTVIQGFKELELSCHNQHIHINIYIYTYLYRVYRVNGKENGNYHNVLYRDYIGVWFPQYSHLI